MKKFFAVVITLLVGVASALPQSFTLYSFTKAKSALDRSVVETQRQWYGEMER